ncbi:M56 family metallopeptidase [Hymenobacter properus]|uniref:M48 family metalloprotease n=1 Tax=Hymenobacter properus TaxID=2791026 RepID=A0A931BER4_9BACT|nr:M56 family metallopeptidase [Hymenobacter properus]MBF9142069.1 M48 family metalloprotease [Hymenobacter properus]MBR7720876.1 M48 family metalloprotease [Microvirga sp. SRT04]
MTALENFVSPALTRALGWTLLHSLWQGALVAAVLAGALLLLRRQRAEVRYVASAGALGVVVALAGITFGLYFHAGAQQCEKLLPAAAKVSQLNLRQAEATVVPAATDALEAAPPKARNAANPVSAVQVLPAVEPQKANSPGWLATGLRYFDQHLPLLVVAWLLGLLAMSLRMLGGLLYVQRLKRYRTRAVSAAWQERLAMLAARGGLRRPVALLESALVQVPLVVGHVRPVILLPLGAVAGLSVAHLEAILAHELAHVLRRDYLVNLLQTVAEALFFYHPAVWFMARCVRTERENCCDDAATALCDGDALRLARALTALAEWSQSAVVPTAPRLALAAMGSRGALLNRVRRLVQRRPAAPTLAEGFMAGALVLGGLGLLGGSAVLAGPLAQPTTPAKPEAIDWQTGPGKTSADTTKRVTGTSTTGASTTTTTTTTATADPASERSREVLVTQSSTDQDRPRPRRRDRRNGQVLAPLPLSGGPGTVVITKDKKGRVTDLVVNGQRIETETGKSKLKIKAKKDRDDDDQAVQIIQVPMTAPVARGFVYRSDADGQVFERSTRPGQTYSYQLQELQPLRNQQFRALTLDGNRGFQRLKMVPNGSANRGFYRQPGALFGLTQDGDGQREALRSAERALQDASKAKGLSAEQRKRINQGLSKVQAQLKQLSQTSSMQRLSLRGADVRDLGQDMRDREMELRDREQELLDRQQEKRDREQEIRERQQEAQALREEMRERIHEEKAERVDRERERADRRREQDDALVDQLLKDGLIKDRENFQLKLTASSLTVNGKAQSQKVFQKYLKLYESTHPGRKMGPTGSMIINRNSNQSTSYDSDGPRPPRPPRPPRAPQAPGAMMAPPAPMAPPLPLAPPPPPAPPRLDSEALRSELRKDGLIGADDKSFQLQLNSSGLTVNGKAQSAETAAKYRKLLGHEKGTYNMTISND